MKGYKHMIYRYLKGQRNRTLLTILGIILSVAMISAIGTIIVSAKDVLLKEAIRDNGSYHGEFQSVDMDHIDKLKNHVAVGKVGTVSNRGAALIAEATEEERLDFGRDISHRYIEIKAYDENAKELLPIDLKEGRLPETSDEIAIEYWIKDYFEQDIKLGDKIKLPVGNWIVDEENLNKSNDDMVKEEFQKVGEREFTVVGFTNVPYVWKGNLVTKGITGLDLEKETGNKFNTYFTIDNIKNAQEQIKDIGKDIGIDEDNIHTNNWVLRLYAQSGNPIFNSSLMRIVAFVVLLIVVSTVAVIYNSFNISVVERISQFGLLRSVGATPKQIRGIVFKEADILSAISIPIGLVSGVFAMKIVFYIIGLLQSDAEIFNDMEVTFSTTVFVISTIVGSITVFLSAIGPALQAGKVSPLEAVRNIGEIRKESIKKVRSSRIIRKILGVEGEIAHKNLRRNRKRFIITVFSMVISIILFITFSTFSDYIFKIGAIGTSKTSDFKIFGFLGERADETYNRLIEMEDVDRVYKVQETGGEALVKKDKINQKLIDMNPHILDNTKDNFIKVHNASLSIIGDENLEVLKKQLNSGSIDIDKMNKENGVLIVNNTYTYKGITDARVLLEGFDLKVGDKIPFASYDHDVIDENTEYIDLTVVGVLEKGIFDHEYNYNSAPSFITTEEVWNKLYYGKNPKEEAKDPYINLYIEMAKDGDREIISNYLSELKDGMPELHYIDAVERARDERNMAIIMSIFLYGFVTLIALISAINIINTISTNIILRTREIAMIKAVGMTQSGIKRMVAFESLFYGFYAIIFGGSVGVGLTYILHTLFIGISEFEYRVPWKNLAITCIAAAAIALISGAYPLKRINDRIIVENMKVEN